MKKLLPGSANLVLVYLKINVF